MAAANVLQSKEFNWIGTQTLILLVVYPCFHQFYHHFNGLIGGRYPSAVGRPAVEDIFCMDLALIQVRSILNPRFTISYPGLCG